MKKLCLMAMTAIFVASQASAWTYKKVDQESLEGEPYAEVTATSKDGKDYIRFVCAEGNMNFELNTTRAVNFYGPAAFYANGTQVAASGSSQTASAEHHTQIVDMARIFIAAKTDVQFSYSGKTGEEMATKFSAIGSSKPLRRLLANPLCAVFD